MIWAVFSLSLSRLGNVLGCSGGRAGLVVLVLGSLLKVGRGGNILKSLVTGGIWGLVSSCLRFVVVVVVLPLLRLSP